MVKNPKHCCLTQHVLIFQSRAVQWFVFLNYVPNHSFWMLVFSINKSVYVCCFDKKLIFECGTVARCYYKLWITQPRNIKPVTIPDTQSMWRVRCLCWSFSHATNQGEHFQRCVFLSLNLQRLFQISKTTKMIVHSFQCARWYYPNSRDAQ